MQKYNKLYSNIRYKIQEERHSRMTEQCRDAEESQKLQKNKKILTIIKYKTLRKFEKYGINTYEIYLKIYEP